MNRTFERLTLHTDWLNHERVVILKKCEQLLQDVEFLQKASPLRRLVGLPDLAFAQWAYNRRVKRYNRVLQQTTTLFHALQMEANQHLDHHFNQQFYED